MSLKGIRLEARLRQAVISGVVFGLFCGAMVLTGCDKKKEAVAPPPPVVEVIRVVPKDVPLSIEYVAQTQSSQQVSINARVSGFLDKRVYTEGAVVKAGDVLFLMDKKPFQVQVDGAAAALARQKAALEVARLTLARIKPLAAKNAVSQKDLDDATGTYESAAAAVEQAKAQLATAQLNLSYCTITSPVTGITSAALQQDGTYLSPANSQLTTVAVLSPIWVNFSISENEMQNFRNKIARKLIIPPHDRHYEVDIVMVDGSLHPYKGRITFAAPSYNAQTGTFLVRTTVENPDGILKPNQYVRTRIRGAMRPNAIAIPQRAVQQGAKGHFAWVITKGGTADYRPVEVGDWNGNDWFINEGLRAGEQVVVDGGMTLRPGVAVTVKQSAVPPETTPAAGAPPAVIPKGSQEKKGPRPGGS